MIISLLTSLDFYQSTFKSPSIEVRHLKNYFCVILYLARARTYFRYNEYYEYSSTTSSCDSYGLFYRFPLISRLLEKSTHCQYNIINS